MALQLILGNSGSGKSYYLNERILQAAVRSPEKNILVIVPEQFTMQTQKELVRLHPDRGLLNVDVLSFQRLAHRIFEEVGADRRTVLEETGKTLLLRRTVSKKQDQLKILRGSLKKAGGLKQMKSMISELTQYDIDGDKMEKLQQQAAERPSLYYKLQDIALLYEGFLDEQEGKYITAEETLEALCQVARRSAILKGSVIALDGFTGFTPIQQKLLKELMILAEEVWVTVTIDAGEDFSRIRGEHELFYLSKKTIHTLTSLARQAGCEMEEPVILKKEIPPRFSGSSQMAFLEANLFRNRHRVYKKTEGEQEAVSIHACANPVQEIHFAARTIRQFVREGGRYQETAVIVGNMASYSSYISEIFGNYEIPCFLDNTRGVLSNPLTEFVRAILDMVQQDFTQDSVFRCLRTDLCGFSRSQVDILENYVLAAGIRGFSGWEREFEYLPKSISQEELSLCREMRQSFMEAMREFVRCLRSGETTVRQKTESLHQVLSHYGIQEQLSRREELLCRKGKAELQKEYAGIYRIVIELMDKMVELLGWEKLSLREYTELLEAGFEEAKVGMIPPTADQVQIGDLERSRLKDVKILLFLGLNDGWVPASASRSGILSDMEREELKESEVELAPTARENSYIQKFYLYLNLTKPSRKLYLSYSKGTADSAPMRPSYVLRSVSRLYGELEIRDEDEWESMAQRVETRQNAVDYLVQGLQKVREQDPGEEWRELYRWYLRDPKERDTALRLVDAAFTTFDERGIGREAARRLYGEILAGSVSRLENFASCAFAHFLRYGLELEQREEYAFRPVDAGNVFHSAVELFSRKIQEGPYDWFTLTREERERLIRESLEEVTRDYGKEILHDSARNEYMIRRMERIMERTVWALHQQVLKGRFRPDGFEVPFSQARDLEAVNIQLSSQERMKLRGRIDRIDVLEDEEKVYVKVIDYKSGNTAFDLVGLYYGLQLQLAVYLNAALELERRLHPDKEAVPAGIFYYRMKDPILELSGGESDEEIRSRLLRELRPDGLVNGDPAVYREMDLEFEKNSSVIPVSVNKDGSLAKASKAASGEQMERLCAFVREKMREIGRQILEGEISAVPCQRKQQTSCEYCVYRSVCALDPKIPGTRTRKLKEYSSEEIWKKIEEDGT